jgi:hypothetical protein
MKWLACSGRQVGVGPVVDKQSRLPGQLRWSAVQRAGYGEGCVVFIHCMQWLSASAGSAAVKVCVAPP